MSAERQPPVDKQLADLARELILAAKLSGLSLAVAESLTGGMVTSALVGVAGASDVLRGGTVAYQTPFKAALLGVDRLLLARRGAVHPDVAIAMAIGARQMFSLGGDPADLGIATTGVAGPDPQDGQPVGRVFVAVATGSGTAVRDLQLSGDRRQIRLSAAISALRLAVEMLGSRT